MLTLNDFEVELAGADPAAEILLNLNGKEFSTLAGDMKQFLHTATAYVNATDGLRVHSEPGTSTPVTGFLPYKTFVAIVDPNPVINGSYAWVKIKSGIIVGWVADKFLTMGLAPIEPSPNNNKIGLHVFLEDDNDRKMGGNDRLLDVAMHLFQRKRPMPFTVLIDQGLANRLQPYASVLCFRAYTNERITLSSDLKKAEAQGRDYVVRNATAFSSVIKAPNVYIQMTNEQDEVQIGASHPAFNLGIAKELQARGYHGALFNDGVGWCQPSDVPARIPVFKYMKDNGHVLGVHMYAKPGMNLSDDDPDNVLNYSQRWRMLYKDVPATSMPLIIGNEAGRYDATFINSQIMTTDMKKFAHIIAKDNGVLCFNWWQYNGSGTQDWHQSAMNSAVNDVETLILTM